MTTVMIRTRRPALSALAALALGAFAPAALAEPVRVPGTGVSMEPPEGFRPSEGFAGFEDPATSSSVLVVEMPPEAYAEIAPIFDSEELATESLSQQGVTVEFVENRELASK